MKEITVRTCSPFPSTEKEGQVEEAQPQSEESVLIAKDSTTYFIRRGSAFSITNEKSLELFTELPAGTYIIRPTREGFIIDQVANFELPQRLYGDIRDKAMRILRTYADRDGSTGVLLSGEKGSGKTLLAKYLSEIARQKGVPTLVINEPLHGDGFNSLLQAITQPCIVIFDEFEKVYTREEQQALLTILDGVLPTKKLFVFTCNDKYSINVNMTNRPGRIYYALDYSGLSDSFIREYCKDQLKNSEHVEGVCRIAGLFSQFNFDILQSLVQEMNRYGENPLEAMRFLNAKPEADNTGRYTVTLKVGDEVREEISPSIWNGHPLHRQEFSIEEELPNDEYRHYNFTSSDLVHINTKEGTYHFAKGDVSVIFTKQPITQRTWDTAYGEYF